jgi:hypothetical protein
MSRWAAAVVALLVVSAFGTSTLVNCVGADLEPEAPVACCAHGHGTCHMHRAESTARDCCRHDAQRQQDQSFAEQRPVQRLVAFVPLAGAAVATPISVEPESTTFARHSVSSPNPPIPRLSRSTVLLI